MTTAAKIEFKASAQFNPVFRPVNEWHGRYRILKGSAGSGKSVNIAQDYIAKLSEIIIPSLIQSRGIIKKCAFAV